MNHVSIGVVVSMVTALVAGACVAIFAINRSRKNADA